MGPGKRRDKGEIEKEGEEREGKLQHWQSIFGDRLVSPPPP
jgi:hypothetical protein